MIINYLNKNNFVYRDLKPDNVMIDENKTIFIIDFDNMIKYTEKNEIRTGNFQNVFQAPEVHDCQISCKSDIYSIGQMIYYIMNEKYPDIGYEKIASFQNNKKMKKIYEICTKKIAKDRPSILELILVFYFSFNSKIKLSVYENDLDLIYVKGLFNYDLQLIYKDINKTIDLYSYAANLNIPEAQNNLGVFFA